MKLTQEDTVDKDGSELTLEPHEDDPQTVAIVAIEAGSGEHQVFMSYKELTRLVIAYGHAHGLSHNPPAMR